MYAIMCPVQINHMEKLFGGVAHTCINRMSVRVLKYLCECQFDAKSKAQT